MGQISRTLTRSLGLAGLLAIVLVVLYWGYLYFRLSSGFEVAGVPYMGMSSTHGMKELYGDEAAEINGQGRGSAGSSLLMVAGFWHLQDPSQPLLTPIQVKEKIKVGEVGTLTDIAVAAKEFGYDVRFGRAYFGLLSLGAYVSAGNPTPFIVEQTFSRDYPSETQNYFRVIVGVSPRAREVQVHDYVFGAAQSVGREEFESLWNKPRRYLVIEPKNRKIAGESPEKFNYSPNVLNEQGRELSSLWYLGEVARFKKDTQKATSYYEKVVRHPSFSQQAPGFQLYQLTALLFLYYEKGRYEDTVAYEKELTRVISKTQTSWVGLDPSLEKGMAWALVGEAHLALGDKVKAKVFAERALAEDNESVGGKQLLEKIQ